MEIPVDVYRDNGQFSPSKALSGLELVGRGVLTDEHATSSYGQPVLVLGGQAYGVWDALVLGWQLGSEVSPDHPLRRAWADMRWTLELLEEGV